MRQERSPQNLVLVLLAVAVLAMSVGFATYSQNLQINGTATFKKASWDVHFDGSSFAEDANNSVASSPATTHTFSQTNDKPTQLAYTVTLEKPGDVYQFTVDVINEGTIDAKLTEIDLSNDQSSAAYISHSVIYDGVTYTNATNSGINKVLASTDSETVTVRVEYVLPANASDLPTAADVTAHLGVTLNYVDNGI